MSVVTGLLLALLSDMRAYRRRCNPARRGGTLLKNTTITKLYMLDSYEARKRFDAFRTERGLKPYFTDEWGGESLTFNRFFIDQADIDEIDQAWLRGAQVTLLDGVRIPWEQNKDAIVVNEPLYEFIHKHRLDHTIWPSSHALIQMDHQLAAFVAEIWRKAEVLP